MISYFRIKFWQRQLISRIVPMRLIVCRPRLSIVNMRDLGVVYDWQTDRPKDGRRDGRTYRNATAIKTSTSYDARL